MDENQGIIIQIQHLKWNHFGKNQTKSLWIQELTHCQKA